MSAKGINKESVIKEAISFIEENDSMISLHELARRLEIKTPSLYNHIKSNDELCHEIFVYAADKFADRIDAKIKGKKKDEAIRAFAREYILFAKENKGLYCLIMSIPTYEITAKKEMIISMFGSIAGVLSDYGLSDEQVTHWLRVLRAVLHGFVSQEEAGYFSYDISIEESHEIAVNCFLDGLHKAGDKNG